eukprot:TRINITY_DN6241_c0_g1_i1.p1 TRINITY_DN6241_c0_g1~~TRINITY_DN6241_c0_g1_i1.p1  ORF type:complete len:233 (+),score=20.51 TRINITY_DN6241_c0_g1_i1:62-700(+)
MAAAASEDRIVRRVIPADNSCLFNSVAYALEERAKDKAPMLRETVAALVLSSPDRWTEAELGKPLEDYVEWIQNDEKWGGGIELAVLAEHYETELAAFDCQSKRVDIFGEDKGYKQRVLLMYDGIHYDVLVRELFPGAPQEMDVTIFDTNDQVAMDQARSLTAEANQRKQFTDTANFTLRCLVCQKGLVGQADAVEHAKASGHTNFAEYVAS